MSRESLTASLETVRRLVVTNQRLAGALPSRVTADSVLSVVRDLAYVQWDPVTTVAPSHLLSFWARLGEFDPSILERLLWKDKTLFEHWTPMASLVLTEDYPLYLSMMRRYPESLTRSWGNHREGAKKFLARRSDLRKKLLRELKQGPLTIGKFEDHHRTKRDAAVWGSSSDVSLMLFHLLMSGDVMVVGHQGNQNLWGLASDFLPSWTDRNPRSEEDFEVEAAQRALRALGVATLREIVLYFPRGRYENLKQTLAHLEENGAIHRLTIECSQDKDQRFIHHEDLPRLESLASDRFEPRLSLVPPFDNLVYSQRRGQRLFSFDYIREQFLPKEKRTFGTYVLPIVWGERMIGRMDPRLDKESATLCINAIHAEPDAPREREVAESIGEAVASLARFVGAGKVRYTSRVPSFWRRATR